MQIEANRARRGLLGGAAALLSACAAPTVLNTQWVDPEFSGKPPIRSVMVMSITKDTANRRTFEDLMVKQLAARGVRGVPSYRYAPEAGAIEQAKLEQAVKESGVAGMLLTRVVNVSQTVQVSPGMYTGPAMGYGFRGFYGFYGGMWASSFYTPPTIYTEENIVADTRLFDTTDFRVVWSGSTTTTPGSRNATAVIQQFTQLIAESLAKDKLI